MRSDTIYGNTVAIDGGEIQITNAIDGGEVGLSNMVGGDLDVAYVTGGGTMEHDRLRNRELPDQHPIEAVTSLEGELEIRPSERLSNMEIYEIINS